jgi:hypothetical protein
MHLYRSARIGWAARPRPTGPSAPRRHGTGAQPIPARFGCVPVCRVGSTSLTRFSPFRPPLRRARSHPHPLCVPVCRVGSTSLTRFSPSGLHFAAHVATAQQLLLSCIVSFPAPHKQPISSIASSAAPTCLSIIYAFPPPPLPFPIQPRTAIAGHWERLKKAASPARVKTNNHRIAAGKASPASHRAEGEAKA